jgi:hypothetical protein
LQFLTAWLAVWLGRVLQEQVDFLKAENRLLRKKLSGKRILLTEAERGRLATLGKKLGRKGLAAVATIASPETILRWYRELVAAATAIPPFPWKTRIPPPSAQRTLHSTPRATKRKHRLDVSKRCGYQPTAGTGEDGERWPGG